jgi:hypothetical protein
VVERARPKQQWPGLFIGRPCWFRRHDISRPPSSLGACNTCLFLLGQFATGQACPCMWPRELELANSGMMGWVRRHVSRKEQ